MVMNVCLYPGIKDRDFFHSKTALLPILQICNDYATNLPKGKIRLDVALLHCSNGNWCIQHTPNLVRLHQA